MQFFLPGPPPTVTAQERSVRVVGGKPVFYEPARLKDARRMLCMLLASRRPPEPASGAVELRVLWCFPKGRHKDGEWRTTRPDTDNLQKLLKDCMTLTGFWKDDSQVCREIVEKRWASDPGIRIEVVDL